MIEFAESASRTHMQTTRRAGATQALDLSRSPAFRDADADASVRTRLDGISYFNGSVMIFRYGRFARSQSNFR
eukprot:scaffold5946_cov114-Isochrysis_galbana.AAC.10